MFIYYYIISVRPQAGLSASAVCQRSGLSASAVYLCYPLQIPSVRRLHLFAESRQLLCAYPTVAERYLLDAAHVESLAVLDGSNEITGIQQTVAVTRVEPCETAAEQFHHSAAGSPLSRIRSCRRNTNPVRHNCSSG